MMLRFIGSPLLLAAFVAIPSAAQDQVPEIIPDRPDPSAVVIPKGSFQIESGLAWTAANGTRTVDLPESLLRFGIGSTTELRLGVPDYFAGLGPRTQPSGFGDLLIGMKQQIVSTASGFNLSLIPALSLPTGSDARSSHAVDAQLQVSASIEFKNKWLLGAVLTVADIRASARRNLTDETLLFVAREIGKSTEVFTGYVGDFREGGSPGHLMEIGGTHRLTRNQQVDVFIGIGFSPGAPDAFVAAGYSVRFDSLWKKKEFKAAQP